MTRSGAVVLAAIVVLAASCDSEGTDGPTIPDTSATTAPGDDPIRVNVDEAAGLADGARVVVTGPLYFDRDGARFCSVFLESYPVQCGAPVLGVAGIDVEDIVGLTVPEPPVDVQWSDFPVALRGVIADGVLVAEKPEVVTSIAGDLSQRFSSFPQPADAGQTVRWVFDITNTGAGPTTIVFRNGQRGDIVVTDELGELYRWSIGMKFTQAATEVTLQPGQMMSFVLAGDLDLEPGDYSGTAAITAVGLDPFPIRVSVR
jgi:hypothetical protein